MWIFIPSAGYFSIVQKRNEDVLTVRARIRADLDQLRERYLPELSPTTSTPRSDYAYRATCSQAALAMAMAKIAADISYDNFKHRVAEVQGHAREQVYARVWSVLATGLPPLDTQQPAANPNITIPRRLRSRSPRPARRR